MWCVVWVPVQCYLSNSTAHLLTTYMVKGRCKVRTYISPKINDLDFSGTVRHRLEPEFSLGHSPCPHARTEHWTQLLSRLGRLRQAYVWCVMTGYGCRCIGDSRRAGRVWDRHLAASHENCCRILSWGLICVLGFIAMLVIPRVFPRYFHKYSTRFLI